MKESQIHLNEYSDVNDNGNDEDDVHDNDNIKNTVNNDKDNGDHKKEDNYVNDYDNTIKIIILRIMMIAKIVI